MSKTETSGVPPKNDALTVTVPAEPATCRDHSVVLQTPVVGFASVPLASPVTWSGVAGSLMTDVSSYRAVQVATTEQV